MKRDRTLVVGKKEFPVNSDCLSWISEVFEKTFTDDTDDRTANKIVIKDDIPNNDDEEKFEQAFEQFLSAMPPHHISPNRKNQLCDVFDI